MGSPRDEVAVLGDSVLVRDRVVRGLVQNMSERMFARDVAVSVDAKRWEFPLTVQPGEVAPFVIEDYRGPSASMTMVSRRGGMSK